MAKVFRGGLSAFVGAAPRWWHVGVRSAALFINEVLSRMCNGVIGESFWFPGGNFGVVLWLVASRWILGLVCDGLWFNVCWFSVCWFMWKYFFLSGW